MSHSINLNTMKAKKRIKIHQAPKNRSNKKAQF